MTVKTHNREIADRVVAIWPEKLSRQAIADRLGISKGRAVNLCVSLLRDGEIKPHLVTEPSTPLPPASSDGHRWTAIGRVRTCPCGAKQFANVARHLPNSYPWVPSVDACAGVKRKRLSAESVAA